MNADAYVKYINQNHRLIRYYPLFTNLRSCSKRLQSQLQSGPALGGVSVCAIRIIALGSHVISLPKAEENTVYRWTLGAPSEISTLGFSMFNIGPTLNQLLEKWDRYVCRAQLYSLMQPFKNCCILLTISLMIWVLKPDLEQTLFLKSTW